jgi:hypothetical protein
MKTSEDSAAELEDYRLFQRAIVDRDEAAWAIVVDRYRRLIVSWANRCCALLPSCESAEELADRALACAWVTLSPSQLVSYPTLAALLGYLLHCVTATSIEYSREQLALIHSEAPARPAVDGGPFERAGLEHLNRAAIWRLITEMALSAQEQLILRESLLYALPPRAIQARHPEQFSDVEEVYRIKRNLFKRL